jgi:hypothetical protein
MMSARSLLSTRRHVQRYECCSRQPEPKAMVSGVSHSHAGGTSQGRAGLGLGDFATDEVFTDEVLSGRAAISGGVQRSAVRTVFRESKNVFEPMLFEPAIPTWQMAVHRQPGRRPRPGSDLRCKEPDAKNQMS